MWPGQELLPDPCTLHPQLYCMLGKSVVGLCYALCQSSRPQS